MFKLVIDQREQINFDLYNDLVSKKIKFTHNVKTLQIGDYGVYYMGILIFVIERKTWKDLAISIKDNRLTEQIIKFKTLGEDVVKLILVEGTKAKQHARIPIANLEAKLDKIMYYHKIPIIYTKSQEETASRILALMERFPPERLQEIADSAPDSKDTGDTDEKDGKKHGGDPLLQVIRKTNETIRHNCLCAINNISFNTAEVFPFKLHKILDETLSIDDIKLIEYKSGGKIGLVRAKKIHASMKIHKSRILAQIPGVTKVTAEKIIQMIDSMGGTFATLDAEKMSLIQKTAKRKLGPQLAKKITEIMYL
jgi:ERCC4-type nuclease